MEGCIEQTDGARDETRRKQTQKQGSRRKTGEEKEATTAKNTTGQRKQSLLAPERGVETCQPPTISEANYKNASCAAKTYAWARPLQ